MDGSNNIGMFGFLWLFALLNVDLWIYRASSEVLCIPNERYALLKLKHHLSNPSNRLASWSTNGNCCNWASIVCNNITGHIHELHLTTSPPFDDFEYGAYDTPYEAYETSYEAYERSMFGGEIHPSLLDLKHLNYLDLSGNDFKGMQIPSFLGSMTSLTYLNLSRAGFGGSIPHQLGNLSNLLYLDLEGNYLNGNIPQQIGNLSNLIYLHLDGPDQSNMDGLSIYVENLQWLSTLTSLQNLELGLVNLSNAFDWLHVLHLLPSLRELHLSACVLYHYFQPSSINFSSLAVLDLSYSYFHPSLIPNWVFQLKKLVYLQLPNNNFQGSIPDGIQNLTLLQHLDLSHNLFNSSIPNWLYNLSPLKSLILIDNNLVGTISSNIGNLTSLVTLDLSYNYLEGQIPNSTGNLCNLKNLYFSNKKCNQQVSKLLKILLRCASQTLESLHITAFQLSSHLTDQIGLFKNLVILDLFNNAIQGPLPNSLGNLTSLKYLDLSNNAIQGALPNSLGNLISLKHLDLSNNAIQGALPNSLGNLISLKYLYLFNNTIHGAIPLSFGSLTSLMYLDLSKNQFNGNPFEILGPLSKLTMLYFEDNLFHGVVKEFHLINFTSLVAFIASRNQLTLKVGPTWSPSFQHLKALEMVLWNLGPHFPSWIQSLKHLMYLDLSNNRIFHSIPTWLWGTMDNLYYLNLSHNYIDGELSNILMMNLSTTSSVVDLSSNQLNGQLPHFSPWVIHIDLSSNWFSGSITHFLCQKQEETKILEFLNLATNNLSGKIPDCWMMLPNLVTVNLENNYLTRILPTSIGSLAWLKMLHLRNNSFFGSFPTFLKKSSNLISLNLGKNHFSGMIPSWVGQSLSKLKILVLRSNKFSGPIPNQICGMSLLQIMDFAQNKLTGHIPKCVNHLRAMLAINNSLDSYIHCTGVNTSRYLLVETLLLLKGRVYDYSTILGLVTSIDLSGNKLFGEIPTEITRLMGLRFLNISNNLLSGQIPQSIGNMELLECMDFSRNHLSGEIPPSISKLSFLDLLNLSYNNLIGKIPTGIQLQSFDAYSFLGNDLCGPPLSINCTSNGIDHNDKEAYHGDRINWFFVSMALGFVMGFWVVVGPLLYCRSWRYVYFEFLDSMRYKLQSY